MIDMRVLAVKRISRDTETSTSLERQDVALREAVARGDHILVHMVEDATVSGAVNLDERKSLGRWLREPLVHEWEAIMVTTQDRITRDDMHWWSFVGWVLANQKTVIVLDDPSLDLSTTQGRMIAGIKASQAAEYRKAVSEKRLGQTAYYREENLWGGGIWPFGYRAIRVEHKGQQRWRLVLDPHTSGLVREAADRIITFGAEEWNLGRICADWNRRGILTAADYQRSETGKPVRGTKWQTTILKGVLSSPHIMGYATHKGEIQRRHGIPIQRADPILSRAEFDKLQAALASLQSAGTRPRSEPTELAGVVFCKCGEPLYSNRSARKLADGTTRHYHYYLCGSRRKDIKCPYRVSWPVELLEVVLEGSFLRNVGDLEIMNRTFVPGEDHSSEIIEIESAMANLAEAIATVESSIVITALTTTMDRYARTLETLNSAPVVPSHWKEDGTGETYRQRWVSFRTWSERADLLRKGGFRLSALEPRRARSSTWPSRRT